MTGESLPTLDGIERELGALVRQLDARYQAEIASASRAAEALAITRERARHDRLLAAMHRMDAAGSLSDVLGLVLTASAAEAARVALFVVEAPALRPWRTAGFDGIDNTSVPIAGDGLLQEAMRRCEAISASAEAGLTAPVAPNLPPGHAAMAVPLVVGAEAVAVLYADNGPDRESSAVGDAGLGSAENPREAASPWAGAVQILARHGSARLALLTVAGSMSPGPPLESASALPRTSEAPSPEETHSARRYAERLVAEIKVRNEAAVRIGRQKADLLERLQPEIERARRLYGQRLSAARDNGGAFFQHELAKTLAAGDPVLLGGKP